MAGMRKRIPTTRLSGGQPSFNNKSSNLAKKKNKIYPRYVILTLVGLVVGYGLMSSINSFWNSRRVFTPLLLESTESNDMTRFWGTYRPQVYMGMKTKSAQSLVTGLMWLKQNEIYQSGLPLRHTCEQGDKLVRYGWIAHDGSHFGIQDIVDHEFILKTQFVKRLGGSHGGDWTWRISATPQTGFDPVTLSIFFYTATDSQGELQPVIIEENGKKRIKEIHGETSELGKFKIKFPNELGGQKMQYHFVETEAEGLHKITDAAIRKMQVTREKRSNRENAFYFLGDTPNRNDVPSDKKTKVIFHQMTLKIPFDIDIVYESGSFDKKRVGTLTGLDFTKSLNLLKKQFDDKFEKIFPLKDKGYSIEEEQFAKAALSNMLGGIGHFYGHSLVQSEDHKTPVQYWDAHLLTAVPSRSFFPRGFLWDEGFHELLISKWDRNLSEEIIQSWLGLINVDGWIPREQILGNEARSKVPKEFVVQHNTNANPPTLFLAIESLMEDFHKDKITKHDQEFLHKIYPRLKAWFNWFNTTQSGPVPFSYRWRGRPKDKDNELNPKTLTSGLDDFPRASHPSEDERHVDLHCWMAFASNTMAKIAQVVYPDNHEESLPYAKTHQALTDSKVLNKLHWSDSLGVFSDYGNHTDRVHLTRKTFQSQQPNQPPITKFVRVELQKPKLQFVNTFGYVSLFPFLLQLLDPRSPQLNQLLQDIKGEEELWTPYGLRSLSKRDPLYMRRNTEHDPPYWRGQIWININFLAVRALKHYASVDGPYSSKSSQLYEELRTNLVRNLFKQYKRTGYLWENYNDMNGQGQGTHPFTGWSALIVLIMSEHY